MHDINQQLSFLITGGSGFIGSHLTKFLLKHKHQITILTRNKNKIKSDQIIAIEQLSEAKQHYDVIINLAGEALATNRWNSKVKQELYNSRISCTNQLINYIEKAQTKPKLLISGSAIGYYGDSLTQQFTEYSTPANDSFTHDLCNKWEQAAKPAELYGVRVCYLRTGIVLGKEGGALTKMLLPFRLGLGGRFGNGKQWMSWIHIDDLIGIIALIINQQQISGPINGVAPTPVKNQDFTNILAKILHRPAYFNMPSWLLKILLGQMAVETILVGQKILPSKLQQANYQFKFPELKLALTDLLNN